MFKAWDPRLSSEKVQSKKVRNENKIYNTLQWKIPPKDEALRPCGGLEVNLFRRTNQITAITRTDQSEKRRERHPFETFWAGLLSSGKLDVLIIVTSCHKFCIAGRSVVEFTREFSNGSLESVKSSVFWPKKPWLVATTRSVLRTEATFRQSKLYLSFLRAFCEADLHMQSKNEACPFRLFWPLRIVFCLFKRFKRAVLVFSNHCWTFRYWFDEILPSNHVYLMLACSSISGSRTP